MFNVMREHELMGVNGGMFAVPYYPSSQAFKKRQPRGITWTSDSRCAYAICSYFYDKNGNLLYW